MLSNLKNESGSVIPITVGLIMTLLLTLVGTLDISFLIGQRIKMQNQLDSIVLKSSQLIDFESYLNAGFSSNLELDESAIESYARVASSEGAMARCKQSQIEIEIVKITVTIEAKCEVQLPFQVPNIADFQTVTITSTARLTEIVN
ncbi:MAG: hypothetical protein GM45_3275 [actinobacterium acAMD-5]|jgi:hypothetical protein|nr:MAG: hypothetical protein GM45_3275 [actinobacterium acAMD-5]